MDLKELAAARLVKLLYDATGIEPRRWADPEYRGMQRVLSDRLGIDEGMLSKVRRGETPNVSLEAISKIWSKTGIRPGYFVEPMATQPTYTSFLVKGDPFADLRRGKSEPPPRSRKPTTGQDDLSQLAESIGELVAEQVKRFVSPDSAITNAARQDGFRSARQGDGLHRVKPSQADEADSSHSSKPPSAPGRSSVAKRKS